MTPVKAIRVVVGVYYTGVLPRIGNTFDVVPRSIAQFIKCSPQGLFVTSK